MAYGTGWIPVDALDDDEDLREGAASARVSVGDRLAQALLELSHVVVLKHLHRGARQTHAEHQRRVVQRVGDHATLLRTHTNTAH